MIYKKKIHVRNTLAMALIIRDVGRVTFALHLTGLRPIENLFSCKERGRADCVFYNKRTTNGSQSFLLFVK